MAAVSFLCQCVLNIRILIPFHAENMDGDFVAGEFWDIIIIGMRICQHVCSEKDVVEYIPADIN